MLIVSAATPLGITHMPHGHCASARPDGRIDARMQRAGPPLFLLAILPFFHLRLFGPAGYPERVRLYS